MDDVIETEQYMYKIFLVFIIAVVILGGLMMLTKKYEYYDDDEHEHDHEHEH